MKVTDIFSLGRISGDSRWGDWDGGWNDGCWDRCDGWHRWFRWHRWCR